MKQAGRVGAISSIAFAVLGIAWFWLELAPQRFGFEDTDDPAVGVLFLRDHSEIYVQAGIVLILMAIALIISAMAAWESLGPRVDPPALRSVSAFGVIAAACFFMHGVTRFSAGPLLYIDSLDQGWGETVYLVIQMIGIHGFAQGAIFMLCAWAVGISLIGWQTRTIPLGLCALGVLPAFRITSGILGPLAILPDGLWILSMLSIPGTLIWCLALGIVYLRRDAMDAQPVEVPEGSPAR